MFVSPSLGRLASALAIVTSAAAFSACATDAEDGQPYPMTPPGNNGGNNTPAPNNASCPSLGVFQKPTVRDQIEPPAGATLMMRYRAVGTQIYTCKAPATGGAAPAWAFKAPEANLLDEKCALVVTHYAGPTWKVTSDGSAVSGMKVGETPAIEAGAIPWLLLKTMSTGNSGVMSGIGYIQRVDTVGGLAPTDGCDAATIGIERQVPYSATYYFYNAPAAAPAPKY